MTTDINPKVLRAVEELREAAGDIAATLDLTYSELIHTIASTLPALIALADDAQDADDAREKLAAFLLRPTCARAVDSWNQTYRAMAAEVQQAELSISPELAQRIQAGEWDA